MERLWTNPVSQVFSEKPHRMLYLCPCNSIDELADRCKPDSPHFGLFLAVDAGGIEVERICGAAAKLLKMGLVYLCAWGPDCERVDDIFDEEDLARDLEGDVHDVIMTTWQDDESLEEALWFFVHSAFPAESYVKDCTDWVIAPVGNTEWEQEIRRKIRSVIYDPPAE